MRCTSRRR